MLKLWSQATALKTYVQTIPGGNTRQLCRADIQNFLLRGWMRSRVGLIVRKIQGRRSHPFWNLSKIRNNFGVSGWWKQRGDRVRIGHYIEVTSHPREGGIYMSIAHRFEPSNCWYCGVELYHFKDHFKKVFSYTEDREYLGRIESIRPVPEGAKELAVDHFIPRSKGGSNVIWNLVPCCTSCNSSKSNKDIEQFRQYRIKQTGIEAFKFWAESYSGKNIALLLAEIKRRELKTAIKEQTRFIDGIVDQYRKKEQKLSLLKTDLQSLEQAIARGEYGSSFVCEDEA